MTRQQFIETISPIIQKYAKLYGYKYPSAIIAQACNESNFGKSSLGATYHNYFGMKCGSSWSGGSVNLSTGEEYTSGVITRIKDNFRVYSSMDAGVKGYFDFIAVKRYNNLKEAMSSYNYLELIKQDGYATSSSYVKNVYAVVTKYGLDKYDKLAPEEVDVTVVQEQPLDDITAVAYDVIRGVYGNGEQRKRKLGSMYDQVQKRVNDILRGKI